ncbi:efflux RND transporter permease subunit [Peptoanaerobacter stomatis]|uniref:efflux RND transporter permease subunit n=1 Tax=Peptoanaerobacter stomatis TaxID=796937 RepID=UPI003F9F3483
MFFRINQTNLINIRFFSKTSDIYNRDLGSVSKDIESLLSQMSLPDGYYTNLGGTTELMNETFSSLVLVIALAIVLVYMIMASQFESLVNPFIIMFTIPLAFSGAWVLLFLTGESMSVMAVIGALVLVGIVVNNGIVLIEYINILRDRDGYSAVDAVLKASPTRLRPILMTAMTTILGQMPLIFSNGDNSEMLRGMGLLIAGGLTTSTLLTLVVIPLMYLVFDSISERINKKFRKKKRLSLSEVEARCKLWEDGDNR